jgi:hypothetical protein
MDYYEDELAKRNAAPAQPKGVSLASLRKGGTPDEGGPMSGVNSFFDIISRPLYGVLGSVKGASDAIAAGEKGGGQANPFDVAGGFLSGLGKGVFSNDPEAKVTGSKLLAAIDKNANQDNPDFDPDAANDFGRGAMGLVMDIGLDPINYIPGALIVKGVKGGVGAVDKGLTAVSEGLVGADRVAGASSAASRASNAAKAAEDGLKLKKPKKDKQGYIGDEENPFAYDAPNASSSADFRPTRSADTGKVEQMTTYGTDLAKVSDILNGAVPGAGRAARPAGVPERLAIEAGPTAARAAGPIPDVPTSPIDDFLADAARAETPTPGPQAAAAPGAVPEPQVAPPGAVIPDEVLDANGAIPTPGGSVADIINASPARQKISDTLTGLADDLDAPRSTQSYNEWANTLPATHLIKDPSGSLRPFSVAKLREDLATFKNPSIKPGLKPSKEYLEKLLNMMRQEYQRTVAPSTSVVDSITAFRARQAADEVSLKNALGDELYDYLAKVNTPARFQKALADIRSVIEPDAGLQDVLRNMDQNLARVLTQRLGIPRAAAAKTPEEAAELAERLLAVNEPYQSALAKGLASALDTELVDLVGKGYAHYFRKLGMKVARTAKKPGEGKGRYVDQLNGSSQYTMLRAQKDAIEIAALDVMRARNIKGKGLGSLYSVQRTEVYKEAVLRVLDDQAKLLDDIGGHMSIGVGPSTVQLSMSEVYRGLLSSAAELNLPKSIDQALFNYGTQAAPTAVTDAVAAAIAGGTREEVFAILTDPRMRGNKGLLPGPDGKRPNNLIDSGHGWGFTGKTESISESQPRKILSELGLSGREIDARIRTLKAGAKSATTGTVRKAPHSYISYGKGDKSLLAGALTDAIMHSKASLGLRAADNEMAFVARSRQEVHKLSSDELAKIEEFLKDPSGTIAKIRAFAERKKRIEAEGAKINASADSVETSEGVVDATLGERLVSTMTAASRAVEKYVKADSPVALKEANETFTGGAWEGVAEDFGARPTVDDLTDPVTGLRANEEWAEVIDDATPLHNDWRDMTSEEAMEFITGKKTPKKGKGKNGKYVDLSEDAAKMVDEFGDRIIDPYGRMKHKIGQWFDQNYRAANAMPVAHAFQNGMSMRTAFTGKQINAIAAAARRISPDQDLLPSVFSSIQRGITPTDPKMLELDEMIRGVLGDFFDIDGVSKAGSMGNVFLRTTSEPDLINAMLKQKGIDQAFDIGLARKTAAEQGIPLDEALSGQWKDWNVGDPLEFMQRMSHARQELAFNKGTAMSFQHMAKGLGAWSAKKQPGFVKIVATGDSRFAAHLPDGWYKKDLATELQRVETVYRTSREFSGQVGEFVRTTYAPLLNAWKFAITLPRPGHHIRNLIGDTSVTYMRRGGQHFSQSWKDAVKVLAYRNDYADVNMLEAATRYGMHDLPRKGATVIKTDKFDFTVDELFAALSDSGALPTYHIGEDFVDASGKLNQFLGKATLRDTKVGSALGGLSEGRDHLARFQHFAQALRQDAKGWKGSKAELIDKAVKEVIKYHPDASLLTTMESKLRLAIPFYSWFGKILPALTESLIMHPGRLSTFNKVSYNWAVANGLDPESLSEPFPDDQLFPSFLTEQALGPQFTAGLLPGADGQYIRMNPGIAHLDVMNTLGADPLRGIAGMISPLIRVPAELLSGGSWSTGAPIRDWSDYVDQSIPGINYLANVSGFSPTGSVESLVKGEGLDQQAQVEAGSKTDFDKSLAVANWISGLGIQNLSRQSYINYAEIEERNRAMEDK